MALLFLSYRVATAAPHAGRLYDRLASHFGDVTIFYDRARLRPGAFWQDRLRQELQEAAAVLAFIDPTWSGSFDTRSEVEDIVRFELETAIRLQRTVVPLLVGGAKLPDRRDLPSTLQGVLDRQFFVIDDTSTAAYAAAVATLIESIEQLEGVVAAFESAAVNLLVAEDYAGAERLLMRQSAAMRERASVSVYLALARLAGRSFNALHPAEREAIEALLRRAKGASSWWVLPALLLAILEIDYYQLHGLVSAAPVSVAEVRSRVGVARLDATSRSLISNVNVSRRARRELQLDALLGAAHD
jgi:hypothetical protein